MALTVVAVVALALPGIAQTGCRGPKAPPPDRDAQPESAPETNRGDQDRTARASEPGETNHPAGAHHSSSPTYVECPVADDDRLDPDALLDQAAESYTDGKFPVAYSCADLASALVPNSVDAHHLRAAAASALGHHELAQITFALALALDPDDPETLAAAAEFYINVLPTRNRETTRVGLEYARRGRARAVVRRRTGRALRARLALLEAQGYNDLGRSDDALERVDEALELVPDLAPAQHERGVALFNLCRFDEAEEAFEAVLVTAPDDPYAHHHLGLLHERNGRDQDSSLHLRRARELAPDEFWAPVDLTEGEFAAELAEAIEELPADYRERLRAASLEVVDLPETTDLMAVDPPFSPTILGLFRGLPYGVELPPGVDPTTVPARAIILYRKNLSRAVKSRQELDEQIRRTLLHELGHLSGLDEDDLRRRGLE